MLSIIIPTLNEEKYLPLLLEQIKKQNFKDYEIIIADANSKDKTKEIAAKYNCRIVPGGLPGYGRNKGAKKAKGDVFLFMDADNIFLPENFLKELLEEFKKRKLGVASFPIHIQGNKFDKLNYKAYNWFVKTTQNFIAHTFNSVLVKKEIFERISGFDEKIKIAEDFDFAKRASKIAKFGFIETKPVITSNRRLVKDGRIKTYSKYILTGFHMVFLGPVKTNILNYKFDYSLKK